ncbi:hypothetical protein [Klebsiella quasipneumoniae]|uniref:hypothetical protein n=1 Tax=Klebsiella quasipneumoniae TaxID=1463165 RepID=UPI003890BA86
MRQHDYFGFDEATQGLRAILSGRAMENPVAVFNTLIDALARTELHPIMVDADANDLLVGRLAELAMKRREEMGLPAWLQIHVIELPVDVRNRETGEPIRVFYTEKDRIMTEVMKAVELGEKSCWRPIAQLFQKTLPPRCASVTRRKIPLRKPEEQAGTRG